MNSEPEKDRGREKDPPKEATEKQAPPPFPKKIPEPPGNLRKRSEWFRKRSE